MDITPDKAEGLAQRALELADFADECAASLDELLGDLSSTTVVAYRELAKLARHYAEIAPKWQAVLDAEPVAVVCNPGAFVKIDWTAEPVTACQPFRESDRVVQLQDGVPVGTKLIIKPAP